MGPLSTKTLRLVALLLMLPALAGTLAACGDDDGGDAGAAESTVPATTGRAGDQGWKRVVPGGDCQCADGSEFSFWVREASPEKVVLYLQDGGACFSAETCAPDRDLYTVSAEGPAGQGGIFDFADERNPFADHSVVYVPYCTGDVHLGNTSTEYAPGLTVRHKGYLNGTAALEHLAGAFPSATEVVVVGESAGSVAAPLYGGLAADALPGAKVTVLAHGSGSYSEARLFNKPIAAWGVSNSIPAWAENAGLISERWSFPALFVQSGRHDPDIVFGRFDYAYDATQESWYRLVGGPAEDLLSRIDANESRIERAGVNLLSYVAPGDEHVVLADGPFYTEEVNGVKLVDWVTRLIEGKPLTDVRCTNCAAG
jgi:hypothetical protein